jgi:hypothetical protein
MLDEFCFILENQTGYTTITTTTRLVVLKHSTTPKYRKSNRSKGVTFIYMFLGWNVRKFQCMNSQGVVILFSRRYYFTMIIHFDR